MTLSGYHRGLNRIFMDTRTFIVTGRYETEANQFSVDLIYSDEELQPFLSDFKRVTGAEPPHQLLSKAFNIQWRFTPFYTYFCVL